MRYQLVTRQKTAALSLLSLMAALLLAIAGSGCVKNRGDSRIEPVYDEKTGRLQLLKYDSDNNGKVDTLSYMDGVRVLRIEIDKDENGTVERWEYYGADRRLEKVGFSRAADGKPDTWSFARPDGSTDRIEFSMPENGKVTRTEYYDKDVLTRAEEDADADGRLDKWETYEGGRLVSVAFDTTSRGSADRRLVYSTDGGARLEVDPEGDGRFVAQK